MSKKPKYTPVSNELKKKVGEGGIPAQTLKKCQDFLESNPVDLTPHALQYLESLKETRDRIIKEDITSDEAIRVIANIIMQLKSNGSMFHYQLISMISDVMMKFVEHVKKADKDFLEIFGVYLKILEIIINKKLTGTRRQDGFVLTQELQYACQRYYTKNDIQI